MFAGLSPFRAPSEREDLREAKNVGDEKDDKHENRAPQQDSKRIPAGRELIDSVVELSDLAIGEAADSGDRFGRTHAVFFKFFPNLFLLEDPNDPGASIP